MIHVPARAGLEQVRPRELVRDVLPAFVLTRVLLIGVTLLIPLWRAIFGLPWFTLRRATGTIFDVWNRWDTLWYTDLARVGYNLRGPHDYKNVAFFPLYPLLVRALHDSVVTVAQALLGTALPDPPYALYLVSGMVVANVCAAAAVAFFYALVRLDYGRAAARRALTLLLLFPPAFFLFAAYSEGTYLLCTTAFFYALRRERWTQAGVWGLLAAATRPPGTLLVLPFLIAWTQAHPIAARAFMARLRLPQRTLIARARLRGQRAQLRRPGSDRPRDLRDLRELRLNPRPAHARTPRRRAQDMQPRQRSAADWPLWQPWRWPEETRRAARHGVPAVAIPLGLVLFMAYLNQAFGDPLWFSRAQHAWWRTFAPPWVTLYLSIVWPLGDLIHGTTTVWEASALHDLAYALLGLGVTLAAWRRLPRGQGVYLWLLWAVILSSPAILVTPPDYTPHHDVLLSLPRLMLMMFPLFTYLALWRRLYPWLSALFALALTIYSTVYLTGAWIA